MPDFYLFGNNIENLLEKKAKNIADSLKRLSIEKLLDEGPENTLNEFFKNTFLETPIIDFEKIEKEASNRPPFHFIEYIFPFKGSNELLMVHYHTMDSRFICSITGTGESKSLHCKIRDEERAHIFDSEGNIYENSKREILRSKEQLISTLKKHIPLNSQRFQEWYISQRSEVSEYLERTYKAYGGGITPNITDL